MPARKKDSSTRARRNKASTAATLPREKPSLVAVPDYESMTVAQLKAEIKARNDDGRPDDLRLPTRGTKAVLAGVLADDDDPTPVLPDRPSGWHQMTRSWWADVWASPMSNEWHESDIHNLYMAAMHVDDMWTAGTTSERQKADAALRARLEPLGLTPYARRRLEWTIESAEEAKDRGAQRRRSPAQPPATGRGSRPDPRAGLHAVN